MKVVYDDDSKGMIKVTLSWNVGLFPLNVYPKGGFVLTLNQINTKHTSFTWEASRDDYRRRWIRDGEAKDEQCINLDVIPSLCLSARKVIIS